MQTHTWGSTNDFGKVQLGSSVVLERYRECFFVEAFLKTQEPFPENLDELNRANVEIKRS